MKKGASLVGGGAHPKSFPSSGMPFLLNIVKNCPSVDADPTPKRGKDGTEYVYSTEKCIVFRDAFPKSRYHFLVCPRDPSLKSLNDLTSSPEHLALLDDMHSAALASRELMIAHEAGSDSRAGGTGRKQGSGGSQNSSRSNSPSKVRGEGNQQQPPLQVKQNRTGEAELTGSHANLDRTAAKDLRFIAGFHGIPSLPMLHMHYMSLDLESDRLKNKKHYNSFATYFFLPFQSVRDDLVKNERVTINQDVDRLEALEKQPMKCLWCGKGLANIPELKSHVPSCLNNKSRVPS